jgi:hypothetical protein
MRDAMGMMAHADGVAPDGAKTELLLPGLGRYVFTMVMHVHFGSVSQRFGV